MTAVVAGAVACSVGGVVLLVVYLLAPLVWRRRALSAAAGAAVSAAEEGEGSPLAEAVPVAAAPEASLLLQWDTLDASSVGLADGGARTASLRAANVSLADLLPRVQPDLRVIVFVCDPARRQRAEELP